MTQYNALFNVTLCRWTFLGSARTHPWAIHLQMGRLRRAQQFKPKYGRAQPGPAQILTDLSTKRAFREGLELLDIEIDLHLLSEKLLVKRYYLLPP